MGGRESGRFVGSVRRVVFNGIVMSKARRNDMNLSLTKKPDYTARLLAK